MYQTHLWPFYIHNHRLYCIFVIANTDPREALALATSSIADPSKWRLWAILQIDPDRVANPRRNMKFAIKFEIFERIAQCSLESSFSYHPSTRIDHFSPAPHQANISVVANNRFDFVCSM